MSYFNDEEFRENMLGCLVQDRRFLKRVGGMLRVQDFEPLDGEGEKGEARKNLAGIALKFWKDYREPVGGMLRTEVLDFIRINRNTLGEKGRSELLRLTDKVQDKNLAINREAMEEKILAYKARMKFRNAIETLIELQEKNELTRKEWIRVTREAGDTQGVLNEITDYSENLEQRILRRFRNEEQDLPYLFIEPFDMNVNTAPRGQISVALAKYGTGKSVFMAHIAHAYAMQGLNVLFFTLEDPVLMVENRMDAALTDIPLIKLTSSSGELRKRFWEEWSIVRGKIKIVDATTGDWNVSRMADTWDLLRNRGFIADLVIVDYDKKIEPPSHYKSENAYILQSTDIYKELGKWAKRDDVFMWIAAQARRGKNSDEKQIVVTGDDAAEDINKLREAGMCIGIGYSPKDLNAAPNGRFLYVAKHRFDKSLMGWPIMGNFEMGRFYDPENSRRILQDWINSGKRINQKRVME